MYLNKKICYNVITVVLILCSIHLFGLYHIISDEIYDVIDLIYYSFLGIFLYSIMKHRLLSNCFVVANIRTSLYIYIIMFGCIIISALSGLFYHGQNPVLSVFSARYFSYFLLFIVLLILNPDLEFIYKLVRVFSLLYCIVFTIQFIVFPTEIVPFGSVQGFDRGLLRVRIEGVGFLTLNGLICLQDYLKTRKSVSLMFFVLSLIFVFMLGFRTLLLTYVISSILLYMLTVKKFTNVIIGCITILVGCYLFYLIPVVNEYVSLMIEKTQAQSQLGEDYVRYQTYNFLFHEVNIGWITVLLGNSMPFESTQYGNLVIGIGAKVFKYISADLGLIGFVFNFGLMTLCSFLAIFIYFIKISYTNGVYFVSAFFTYLIISSITTAEIYRAGMFGVIAVAMYITIKNIENVKKDSK